MHWSSESANCFFHWSYQNWIERPEFQDVEPISFCFEKGFTLFREGVHRWLRLDTIRWTFQTPWTRVANSLCLPWVSTRMFRSILLRLRNCHEVLGISPQASRQELKHRYHELARSLHPDVSSGEVQPGAQFAELREAYEACLRLARPRRHGRPGSPMSSGAASFTTAAGKAGSTGSPGSAGSAGGTLFGGFPTTPPHLRTTFPGAWTNFRPKALNGGTYQGQPWKWRIRGPLTLSAQRKGSFTMRRWDGKDQGKARGKGNRGIQLDQAGKVEDVSGSSCMGTGCAQNSWCFQFVF